jgi:hypothetical protein
MALTVETGAGLADADSYISLADWKTWADGRARSYTDYADSIIEARIRFSFDYTNTYRRFKAITLTSTQAGEFPRDGLVDWNGRAVTGVPNRVVWANCEFTWAQLIGGEDLYQNLDRGGRVASESVGPISVSYFADAPAGKVWTAGLKHLEPYFRSPQDAYAPYIGGTAGQASTEDAPTSLTPLFSVGMHSNNDS